MLLSDLVILPTVVNEKLIGYDDISLFDGDLDMVTDAQWQAKAKGLLKAELKRRDISYRDLVQLLEKIGISDSEANIANKISRGGFSAVFLLQCFEAIGCKNVAISVD